MVGSYWTVPKSGIPSLLVTNSSSLQSMRISPIRDQTVWVVNGANYGYFWGMAITKLGPAPPQCVGFAGSIDPSQNVLIGFVTPGTSQLQHGYGKLRKRRNGKYVMMMQTASSVFFHWAKMVQSEPTDLLPWPKSTTVEEFVAPCNPGGFQVDGLLSSVIDGL